MEYFTCLLCYIVSSLFGLSLADTHVLYDTKTAHTDLDWTLHPAVTGWEELSGFDLDRETIRYFQVCNTDSPNQNNWARSPFINAISAKKIYVDLQFTVVKCDGCRETFTLYYYPSSTDIASSKFPPWKEDPFIKIDTIAANSGTDLNESGPQGINNKTLAFNPMGRSGFYIAVQDLGACMSVIGVRLYYHYCPSVTRNLARFPKTVSDGDLGSLIPVVGKCVPNAFYSNNEAPKYRCNSNGEWKVPTGSCQCATGYFPNLDRSACTACPAGQYKSASGNHGCTMCPSHSNTLNTASTSCSCDYGYHRSSTDPMNQPCTRPPSRPINLEYNLNWTSVEISWSAPLQTGGRNDLYYSVGCRKCNDLFVQCHDCSPSVRFFPDDTDYVRMTSIKVSNLELFSDYIFTVTSYNGVSSVSGKLAESELIRVSTVGLLPSPVVNVSLIGRSLNSLILKWSKPLHSNGKITKYEVRRVAVLDASTTRQDVQVKTVADLNYTISGLKPSTSYVITIRGFNNAGWGRYSSPKTYMTESMTQHSAPGTQEGDSPIIIIVVVVGVVSLILGVAVFFLVRRKRKERAEAKRVRAKLGEAVSGLLDQSKLTVPAAGAKASRKTYVDYRDPHQGVKEIACEIDESRIKIECVIGQGEFGEVCRGKLSEGKYKTTVAVKRLRHGASLRDQTNFYREACTMAQFHDPNIVMFKGVVTKSMPAMILSEYMENGSLDLFLEKKKGKLTLIQLLNMLKGIASGMRYLSNMKYIHRDLAARNILVDTDLNCKVTDFGLSRTLENEAHATYTTQGGKIALRWTAPECIRHRQFTTASDVWSYGIVMWEVMSYGEKPYWDMSNDDVTQVLEDGYRLPAPENCPPALHHLMLQCWSYDRRRRPTFPKIVSVLEQFIQHPNILQDQEEMVDLSAPLLSPHSPTSIQDVHTLDQWLDMVKLGRYRLSFYAQGINDLNALARITPSDLERLGIASVEHRSRLQSGLDTLRRHIGADYTENGRVSGASRVSPQTSSLASSSFTLTPSRHIGAGYTEDGRVSGASRVSPQTSSLVSSSTTLTPSSHHAQGNLTYPDVALV